MKSAQNLLSNKKGFSLLEILISVTIIVILTGVVLLILDPVEYYKQGRDARRISDFLSLQTAIISALANGDITLKETGGCNSCNSFTGTNAVDGSGWVIFESSSTKGFKTFMQNLPKDPLNNDEYHYSFYSDEKDFEINVRLESEKYKKNAELDGGNNDGLYERGTDLTVN